MSKQAGIPDWETLPAHAALLQTKIPAAVLVGGTAAALHAHHRVSFDHWRSVQDQCAALAAALIVPPDH